MNSLIIFTIRGNVLLNDIPASVLEEHSLCAFTIIDPVRPQIQHTLLILL